MNKRKFFGTILGILFWSVCVVFFTFAYYEWKSENTSIVLGINDLSTKCMPGTDVNVSNIGPVLNYQDGVISEFSIENGMNKEMAIDLRLDITSISDNLLTESFKYAVVTDTTGGTTYDYDNPVIEGTFENFKVGSNLITTALVLTPSITQNFLFIVYIDGNMKNDPNMQNNSLVSNLMIGNCEENATALDELIYQAIYSETDNSLTFIHNKPVTVGDIYNDKAVTAVYTGFETTKYNSASAVPWYADGNYANITSITFEESVAPKSTAYWFYKFSSLTNIDLEMLDTSNVITMTYMFNGCSSLTNLDLSNFDTSNVTDMLGMFEKCTSLTGLDLSNFNTSNVTRMNNPGNYSDGGMFRDCSSLISLNISNFDTSKIKLFSNMFNGCSSLIELDLSNFDTSLATDMAGMFTNCSSLLKLDISNFNTSNVTSMANFYGGMFQGCSSLTILDVSNFDTSKVIAMYRLFNNCSSLINLDISSWNTSNVTSMDRMFAGCSSLTSLDISKWDTSSVTSLGNTFSNCSSLKELDLSNWVVNNVTNMHYTFNGCGSLTSLDISKWNTSSVTDMHGMFYECSSLTSLDVSNWNTSSVTNMFIMFYSCTNLTSLDLSRWDTSSVTDMEQMFYKCHKLKTSITIKNVNIEYRLMFNMAATEKNADGNYIGEIIVNYAGSEANIDTLSTLVDNMIATKSSNSNVVKGTATIIEETTE